MATFYGIDLGTTHSLAAVYEHGRARVITRELIPSVVAVNAAGQTVVGAEAAQILDADASAGVRRFKGEMGTDTVFRWRGGEGSAIDLSAKVLRRVVMAAAEQGHQIRSAVITVPAWFRETQRAATVEAARLAGVDVTRIINEPTAAALAWGLQRPDTASTIAVLDLGGGTFDVTCLELYDGVVDVRGSVGDVQLGGEDFTDGLVSEVLAELGGPTLDGPRLARLRAACERAKRQLSDAPAVSLDVPDSTLILPLDGDRFDQISQPHLRRMRRCVQQALVQAKFRPAEIESVLLVGGATRMPCVRDLARELFGREPLVNLNPEQAIAVGAAIQAALVGRDEGVRDFMLTDILTHTLGVNVVAFHDGQAFEDRLSPVVSRGTTLPVSVVEPFTALHPEQTRMVFNIYQGEHRIASQNQKLGELVISDLPVAEQRAQVNVRFTCDPSGMIQVEGEVVGTGQRVVTVIERANLSDEARQAALDRIQALQTPPEQLFPNRLLLDRGAAICQALSGSSRDQADRLVLQFEAVLRSGEPRRIERARGVLKQQLDELVAHFGLGL